MMTVAGHRAKTGRRKTHILVWEENSVISWRNRICLNKKVSVIP
jgi:hypothetical protein